MAQPRKTKRAADASKSVREEYSVFISHATADKWIARMICEKIDAQGAIAFRDDRDIQGGDDIPETIIRAIKKCREFLVLLTPQSVARPWVLLEIGMARAFSKRIVPILYHVSVDPAPDMIKSYKAISLNQFDDYLTELAARLGTNKP